MNISQAVRAATKILRCHKGLFPGTQPPQQTENSCFTPRATVTMPALLKEATLGCFRTHNPELCTGVFSEFLREVGRMVNQRCGKCSVSLEPAYMCTLNESLNLILDFLEQWASQSQMVSARKEMVLWWPQPYYLEGHCFEKLVTEKRNAPPGTWRAAGLLNLKAWKL